MTGGGPSATHLLRDTLKVRHRPRLRLATVAAVEQLSPAMRRVVFEGEALVGFESASPDDHVKLFLPAPGQTRPALPVMGPDGPVYAEGVARPVTRDYTPRRFDAAAGRLTIDMVLHGDGPGASWAAQAAPGQSVGIGGPRSSALVPDDCDFYLLAGDETALPAIGRFLEEMRPGVRAAALIEVADAREERYLPTAANARVVWLFRDGQPAGGAALLEGALREIGVPCCAAHAWIAGEIEVARRLRELVMTQAGLPRGQVRAAGYWRIGAAGAHTRLDGETNRGD
jgi:NADPH-dependent ferric siderophore reductase